MGEISPVAASPLRILLAEDKPAKPIDGHEMIALVESLAAASIPRQAASRHPRHRG
jgi:hypothetical protein